MTTGIALRSLDPAKALPAEIIRAAVTALPTSLAWIEDDHVVLSAEAASAYQKVASTDFSKTSWAIDDDEDQEIIAVWVGLGGSFIADYSASAEQTRIFAWLMSPVPEAAQFALKHLKGRDGRWVPTSLLASTEEFIGWIDDSRDAFDISAVNSIIACGPIGIRFRAKPEALPTFFTMREYDGFRAQVVLPGNSPHWERWLSRFTKKTGSRFLGVTSANLSDLGREVRSGGTHKDLAELQADMGHLGIPILSGPISIDGKLVPPNDRKGGYKLINRPYLSLSESERESSAAIAPISTSLVGFTEDRSVWELLRHGSLHETMLSGELQTHGIKLENRTSGRLELSHYVGDLVAAFPLFSELDASQIAEISQMIEMLPFDSGDTIIREGDRGEKMFFIASGSVRTDLGKGIIIGAGNFFGEISLVEGIPRTATISGVEPGVLLALDTHILHRLMEFLPEFAQPIRDMAKDRLSQIEKIRTDTQL